MSTLVETHTLVLSSPASFRQGCEPPQGWPLAWEGFSSGVVKHGNGRFHINMEVCSRDNCI